ncbi:MAG: DUF6029 family protein [Bacteroidetes bacterium]|nr:DUF6029 family protein [Bacteroidota bacterium]
MNCWQSKFFLLYLLFSASLVEAQLSGSNISEYQFGNLPKVSPFNYHTFYNRSVLQYSKGGFKVNTMLELFQSPVLSRNYINPTQIGLSYKNKIVEVKLGNFFETVGRGTLLRSFEIPGSILEDKGFRSRSYFFRDVFGASVKLRLRNFQLKGIHGNTLDNLYPPNQSFQARRPDQVSVLHGEYNLRNHKIGAATLWLNNAQGLNGYGMLSAGGPITSIFNYYAEFSKKVSDENISDFSTSAAYAFYGGLNFSYQKVGASLEIKKYQNFLLGSGINQPPALVREHTTRVLNRSTHVLQPSNESGIQLEAFYEVTPKSMLTLNYTYNTNFFGKPFYFNEYFAEFNHEINAHTQFKIFADYANDDTKLEKNRVSSGVMFDFSLFQKQKFKIEVEFQKMQRLQYSVVNQVYALSYFPNKKLTLNAVLELSNDPFLTSVPQRYWPGINAKYKVNEKISIQIFAGKRRGGPSCNAGICYEVLDFEGVETRVSVRF